MGPFRCADNKFSYIPLTRDTWAQNRGYRGINVVDGFEFQSTCKALLVRKIMSLTEPIIKQDDSLPGRSYQQRVHGCALARLPGPPGRSMLIRDGTDTLLLISWPLASAPGGSSCRHGWTDTVSIEPPSHDSNCPKLGTVFAKPQKTRWGGAGDSWLVGRLVVLYSVG